MLRLSDAVGTLIAKSRSKWCENGREELRGRVWLTEKEGRRRRFGVKSLYGLQGPKIWQPANVTRRVALRKVTKMK